MGAREVARAPGRRRPSRRASPRTRPSSAWVTPCSTGPSQKRSPIFRKSAPRRSSRSRDSRPSAAAPALEEEHVLQAHPRRRAVALGMVLVVGQELGRRRLARLLAQQHPHLLDQTVPNDRVVAVEAAAVGLADQDLLVHPVLGQPLPLGLGEGAGRAAPLAPPPGRPGSRGWRRSWLPCRLRWSCRTRRATKAPPEEEQGRAADRIATLHFSPPRPTLRPSSASGGRARP